MHFAILLAVLALAAAILHRIRLGRALRRDDPTMTDDLVRQIEERGSVEFEEPLDLDHIQEEEDRFWEEQPWEEPDEW